MKIRYIVGNETTGYVAYFHYNEWYILNGAVWKLWDNTDRFVELTE